MSTGDVNSRTVERVAFDTGKIRSAIEEAFHVAKLDPREHELDQLVEDVAGEIRGVAAEIPQRHGDSPSGASWTEDLETGVEISEEHVRNTVERCLVRRGFYQVSRRYIIYRRQRRDEREREENRRSRHPGGGRPTVRKRDGRLVPLDFDKIEDSLRSAATGLSAVSVERVMREFQKHIYGGLSTEKLERALLLAAGSFTGIDPEYDTLCARLLLRRIYREVIGKTTTDREFDRAYRRTFVEGIRTGIREGAFSARFLELDLERLAEELQIERDERLAYGELQRLYERHFARFGRPDRPRCVETPQGFWMRTALSPALDRADAERRACELYRLYSDLRVVCSVPATA